MKSLLLMIVLVLAVGAHGSPSGPELRIEVDREAGTASVVAREISLSRVIDAAELRSGIFVQGGVPESTVSMTLHDVPLDRLVEMIVREAGLTARRSQGKVILDTALEPTVSVDVVEADARSIVQSLARQCGVRNVMIDPEVDTKATLLFRDVPCSTAFRVAFSTLDLEGELMSSSVLVARKSR